MKTFKYFSILTLLILSLASCTKVDEGSSSGGGDDNGDGGTGFGQVCACATSTNIGSSCTGTDGTTQCNGTYNPGTGNNGGSGGNCTGTTADGTGNGTSIHHFDMVLAGHQSWLPGTYSNNLASSTMPTVQEAMYLFRSDNRLKIRVKVNSQPYPTVGEEYCYGRETGKASDAFNYTKLKFRVHLRDVMCDTYDAGNNSCTSGWYLGPRYRTQYINPTGVDQCSQQIDLGSMRNQTQHGTVVEVEDVKSDSTCQYNNTYCPAEKIVRAASCWHMTLQIVTDYTQDFKN